MECLNGAMIYAYIKGCGYFIDSGNYEKAFINILQLQKDIIFTHQMPMQMLKYRLYVEAGRCYFGYVENISRS